MLEMIREYASECLEIEEGRGYGTGRAPGETPGAESPGVGIMRRLHAEYYLALAQEAELQLSGSQQVDWLYRLEEEHDNLRGALRWAVEQGETELALRLAGTLWKFWELHGYLGEGRRWLAAALSSSDMGQNPRPKLAVRAKALFAAGRLAERQGDYAAAQPLLEESLTISRVIEDKPLLALALHNLSNLATYRGAHVAGRALAEESLAIRRDLGDRWGIANVLHNLGFQASVIGDYAAGRAFYEESLAISRELEDKWGIAYSLDGLGLRILDQGDFEHAGSLLKESLALRRELGDKSGIARSFERLAKVAGKWGQPLRAARLFGAAEALRENEGIPIMPVDRPSYEQDVEEAQMHISDDEWTQAWQEGQAMSMDYAADYALGE
jgi:non-specific serine/threonine protein kinase